MKSSDQQHLDVEQYIYGFPPLVRERMEIIRHLIFELAPEAVESFSYGMPAYKWNKKPLVYYAGYDKHIGLYATPVTHVAFQEELKNYKTGKGSVQFPLNKDLPVELIRRMILHRINELQKPS